MKHVLIATILTLSFFYSFSTSAQSWMTDSLKWKETREQNFGDVVTTAFVTYATETINDTLYRRIHRTNCSLGPVFDIFSCHIRSEGNKVYVRVEGQEYLLYDFDLMVGDTYTPQLCVYYDDIQILDSNIGILEVTEVSTITIDGDERNLISFSSSSGTPQDLKWIEGVGSNKGLFHGVEICFTDVISRLSCFERNMVDEYMSPEFETCCVFALSDGISENGSGNGQIMYPNPISAHENVKWSEGFQSGHLTVFTQEGKLMYRGEISEHSSLTPSKMGLSQGLYHLQLEMEGKLHHQKIVVY